MLLEISKAELQALLQKQISNLFILRDEERLILSDALDTALDRCKHCFSYSRNKYYQRQGRVYFNPFHSGQYSIFLYFISNAVFQLGQENSTLADRIYYLNKCLNGLDLFYEVEMPEVFFLDHPVGAVLGRAKYGEFFSFSQNCTVGNNKGKYPILGKNVKLMSGAKVLGNCVVGDNVIFSANSYAKDVDIPSCSIVFGSSPNIVIKRKDQAYFNGFSDADQGHVATS